MYIFIFQIIKEELAEASLEKNKINEEIKQIKDSIKSDSNSGTTGYKLIIHYFS